MKKQLCTLVIVLITTGTSFAQGNGNSANTPADTAANSQASLRWKLSGNQIQGAEFIGTTNQKDLIFKSNNLVGLTITPTKDFKIPGQIYLELHKPTIPGEQRFLTVDYYGKVQSMKKSGLLDAIYASPCKDGPTSGTYTPIWASTTGILWTGDLCAPARVGINTNSPMTALDVRGGVYASMIGVGTVPETSSLITLQQTNPHNDGINIRYNTATNYTDGVGLRITMDNDQRKAISVNTSHADAFYIAGNGSLNFNYAGPSWNHWTASVFASLGSAWVTSSPHPTGEYSGFGIDEAGLFYAKSSNNPSGQSSGAIDRKYLFSIDLNGEVHCRAVKVDLYGWSDFVFDNNYTLMPLDSLQTYIDANNHLPGIPSEQELQKEGLDLAEMQKLQMQKIEELTLYILQLERRIKELEVNNE